MKPIPLPSHEVLRQKESDSIYILRETVACYRSPALLWSIGKDSTCMLHLMRKAFCGRVPVPVVHIDTAAKFPEMYLFRDRIARRWGLDLIVARNEQALAAGVRCCMDREATCCTHLKTEALKQCVAERGFDALLVGIRRDEHGVRAKERYFSPREDNFNWNYRNQPVELLGTSRHDPAEGQHVRVHPLLHWTELDVWCYTAAEKLPVNELYFARDGQRYRSLGCRPATEPVASEADSIGEIIRELCRTDRSERAGRMQDKESAARMQRLRSLGYM